MRILILTIYHDPEPIPKTGELARELQRRGHAVTVVTAFPHYPTGHLYPSYKLGLWRWEVRDGVRILRTYIYPYHGRRSSLRILNYLSWMVSSIQAAWLAPPCDVMYVWHPPLTVGVSAWVIAKLKRVRFVYDVQDFWPESAVASGLMRPGRLVGLMQRLADWVYRRAPRILVVSRTAVAYLQQRGVDRSKIEIGRHWIEPETFGEPTGERDLRTELGLKDRFVIMFAGNIGMVQDLDTIIEAAARIGDGNVLFLFVGDGSDRARLESVVHSRGLDAVVRFAGPYPGREMGDVLAAADALIVHLRHSDIADLAIPTKILAYLAAGRPVIAAVGTAGAALVEEAGAGIACQPGQPDAIVEAVNRLRCLPGQALAAMGAAGRAYVSLHLTRERVIDDYERILSEVAVG